MNLTMNFGLKTLRRFNADQTGAAIVEMTIIIPILVFLALGMGEFGRLIQHHHAISKGVRDAGRYLSRVPGGCPAPATWSTEVTKAKNLAMRGDVDPLAPLLIDYWADPATVVITAPCFDNSTGTFRGANQIPIIRVTASVPYLDIGFVSVLGLPAMTMGAFHEEMHIGE